MRLKSLEIIGFKSFAKKTSLEFQSSITSVVGPNGSGKSNVVEAVRFVLGEQSMKSMRGKAGLDLIFKGSKALPKASRASVTIYFDNSDGIFKLENEGGEKVNLNYETISISREVFADGLNKYSLNGSDVRLKDIMTLLSSVNIGSSGHHIISQGEADRILNASPKDRREMIEDALGLKIYQYKIKDSERKLERTENNMKEVSLLRKEIAPHLNFLRKQVEKLEKAKDMKVELLGFYREYLKKESVFIENEKNSLDEQKKNIHAELADINSKINTTDNATVNENPKIGELKSLENQIDQIRRIRAELERKLGRIEGMIEMEENRAKQIHNVVPNKIEAHHTENKADIITFPKEEFEHFFKEANEYIEEAMFIDVVENIQPMLGKIKDILERFARTAEKTEKASSDTSAQVLGSPSAQPDHSHKHTDSALLELKQNQSELLVEMQKIADEEKNIGVNVENIKREIESEVEAIRVLEREKFTLKVRHQELTSNLSMIQVKEESLHNQNISFENELKEGSIYIGAEILSYKNFEIVDEISKYAQEELHRKIERIKIKLEDAGLGGSTEVLKEYEEVRDRDAFLAKEMEDLAVSISSLRTLMLDLKEKIDIEFKQGVTKINKEFQEFFALMFGGGAAFLTVVAEQKKRKGDEDEEEKPDNGIVFEHGIEISVSLPHKKVKELHALSGGERSLTSIALLFAMSQVNPPPFLVLDETDAALDESNSRKYGDMLEKLSHHSQLIVVTHNRETMSRAGILYGVTVGSDGGSKLLSVKFEEAAQMAK